MAKTIGILAFLAFICAGAYSVIWAGDSPRNLVATAILPLWGVGASNCADPFVECWTWSAMSEVWWKIPYAASLAYGWALALACLIWRRWNSICPTERRHRFSAAQAISRERERQAKNTENRRLKNGEVSG